MLTLKFLHDRAPSLQFRIDRCFELLVVRVVKSRIRGIDRGERLRNMLRDRFGDNRIDREMRIAERVNIAGSARDVGRHIHQTNSLRRLHATGFADFDLGVARVLQERWQPADLEFCAAVNQYIGVA